MKVVILNGSFRRGQNTDTLCEPLAETLMDGGAAVETIYICEKQIATCVGCYGCQRVMDSYGCKLHDDMYDVVDTVIASDCFLLATPIYSWYCTAPMKAMLDRFYGMNKYYGPESGTRLWEGKPCGLVTTHGYDRAYATEPFETGIRRLCEHSGLPYIGMLSCRDEDDRASFVTAEAIQGARDFAGLVLARLREVAT